MRKAPAIPIFGHGRAQQQPVYYRDLAEIACAVLTDESCAGEIVSVGGPTIISQRDLYGAIKEIVQDATQQKGTQWPVIFQLPAGLTAKALVPLETIGLRAPVKSAQISRANDDKLPLGANIRLGRTPLTAGLREMVRGWDLDGQANAS